MKMAEARQEFEWQHTSNILRVIVACAPYMDRSSKTSLLRRIDEAGKRKIDAAPLPKMSVTELASSMMN